MTEVEKIDAYFNANTTDEVTAWELEIMARDLARKLDIVMGLLDPPSPGFNWPEYKTELAAQARAAWERTE